MKIVISALLFISLYSFAQDNKGLDNWNVGVGLTNALMHGDLSSVNNLDKDALNTGFYVSVGKMFSPVLGVELKGQSLSLKGFSQELSSGYPIEFVNYNNGNLYFEGDSFGAELNLIVNLSGFGKNPYQTKRKFNFTSYFGLGYHTYSSELFSYSDLNGVGFSYTPDNKLGKNAIYFNTGLGIKYFLNKRLDLELRQNFSFNSKDNLDAAITKKQVVEAFFTTQLGLVIKLYEKDSQHVIWSDVPSPIEEKTEDTDQDKDGVVDRFDVENDTPKGSKVYANGVAVDSDKDGVIDFYDNCPLVAGIKDNKGCPVDKTIDTDGDLIPDYLDKELETPKGAEVDVNGVALDTDGDNIIDLFDKCILLKGTKELEGCPKDTDKDGVYDIHDLCPNLAGNKENNGCPTALSKDETIELSTLADNIYFESGKYFLRDSSKRQLEKVFEIMDNNLGLNFIIEGHTDSGGKREYNIKLSQNRVNSVKTYLIRLGVEPSRLKSIGYGFSRPRYTNISAEGRGLNRRVEIIVDDNSIDEFVNSQTHVVKFNDTLFSIGKKYNVSIEQLKLWNNLTTNNIVIGSKLIIKKD